MRDTMTVTIIGGNPLPGAGNPRPASRIATLFVDTATLVTIKDGDGWHVSLWYSVAEAARKDAGKPAPEFGQGVEAKGADSPEAAVEELFASMGTLDVRRMIELTPPDEMAALHDYAPLFLDDAEAAAPAGEHWSGRIFMIDAPAYLGPRDAAEEE